MQPLWQNQNLVLQVQVCTVICHFLIKMVKMHFLIQQIQTGCNYHKQLIISAAHIAGIQEIYQVVINDNNLLGKEKITKE